MTLLSFKLGCLYFLLLNTLSLYLFLFVLPVPQLNMKHARENLKSACTICVITPNCSLTDLHLEDMKETNVMVF